MSLQRFRLIWTSVFIAAAVVFAVSIYKPEKWLWLVLIPFLLTIALSLLPLFLRDVLWEKNQHFRMVRQFIGSYYLPTAIIFFIIHLLLFVIERQYHYAVTAGLFFVYAVSIAGCSVFLRNRYPAPGVDYE